MHLTVAGEAHPDEVTLRRDRRLPLCKLWLLPYDRLAMEGMLREQGDRTGLRGRARECALLDELVSALRVGKSRSLLLRGEAGIGKTALLEHMMAAASDLNIVRAEGVESEMELPFAGLHQLCGPLLDHIERLPAPQRQALETVFGMSAGEAPDRFF